MDSCQTPTIVESLQFNFSTTTPNSNALKKNEDIINLKINRMPVRCFTPTTNDFRSPGLSPITDENGEAGAVGNATEAKTNQMKENFVKPASYLSKSTSIKSSKASSNSELTIANVQQQQQQYQNGGVASFDDNSSDGNSLNFSTSTKVEGESGSIINISQSISELSNNNNNSGILNHTLSVAALLQQAGLGQHAEKFAKHNIDLGKFLNMKKIDLKKIGLESDADCQALMDMLTELNAV